MSHNKHRKLSMASQPRASQRSIASRNSKMPNAFRNELDRIKKNRVVLERSIEVAGGQVNGTSVTCPFHEDNNPSGSIHQPDEAWLYTCHTCTWNDDKKTGDVFDVIRKNSKSNESSFDDLYLGAIYLEAGDAIQFQRKRFGKPTPYFYRDIDAVVTMMSIRFDGKNGKNIRPFRRVGNNWKSKRPTGLLPLYRLKEIMATDGPVYVLEGEKCVEAARAIDLNATTSAFGSQAAKNTDWSPLAGRDVAILPDNDKGGAKYAEDVMGILQQLDSPATVKVVELPELSDKEDIVDYIEGLSISDPDEIRKHIQQLVDDTQPLEIPDKLGNIVQSAELQSAESGYTSPSFPVEVLPDVFQRYIRFIREFRGAVSRTPLIREQPERCFQRGAIAEEH